MVSATTLIADYYIGAARAAFMGLQAGFMGLGGVVLVKSGSRLGYVDVGDGIPIILIHGLFLDHTAFEEQIKAFADRHRIIAIDIHGHNASGELDRSISLDEMAEDYSAVIVPLSNNQKK
jgi:pimeloyl-ACP methyl ester carboxylesterase